MLATGRRAHAWVSAILAPSMLAFGGCDSAAPEENVGEVEEGMRGCDETGAFQRAANLGRVVNSAFFDGGPTVDEKETELIFASRRANGISDDLYVSHWTDSRWGSPEPIVELNDPVASDASPRLSRDGLTLYFSSNRAGGSGSMDLWVSSRTSHSSPWGASRNLGPLVNTPGFEGFPTASTDELALYFDRNADIWASTRASVSDPWGAPQRLPSPINTPGPEFSPSIDKNDRVLYFASGRPGNVGIVDIWMSTRQESGQPWSLPVNLGSKVNAAGSRTLGPFITAKDCRLYFMSDRAGGQEDMDLYSASRSQ
jgi:WD40-like Beta Propeller Repeat